MSMPGYREQYPEEEDQRRYEDDCQAADCDAGYDQWFYENEPQGNYGLIEDDMMLIVLDMLAGDW